jgi:hypothetical protein
VVSLLAGIRSFQAALHFTSPLAHDPTSSSATTDGATASATTDTRRDGSDEGGQPAVVEEGGELESTRVPATVPPPRSISKPGSVVHLR